MTASAQTAPAQTGPTPTDTTLTATSTPPAAAPTTPTPQAAATPNPIKAGDWTISIWNRTRVESWDYFQGIAGPAGNAGDGEYSFVGNLLRVGALNANPKRDIQLEISQPTLLGLPRTATAFGPGTAGQGGLGLGANYYAANLQRNDYSVFLKQAFVRLKSLIGAPGNSLRLGRFEFIDGLETTPKDPTLGWLKRERIAHRLIGNFGFSHVQRSFDGGQVVFNNSSSNITLAALRPTAGVFDVDANGNIGGVSVLYGAWTKPAATSDTRIFTSYYRDSRDDMVKVDNRPLPVRAADTDAIGVTTLGLHHLRTLDMGSSKADLLFWGALQGGDWGRQSHRAGAFALEAGYQPQNMKWKPWVRVGYNSSTGDDDATDDRHGTFFQMLPTPRIYARTPFYNSMNNQDLFAQLILRPSAKTTIRTDVHRVDLANKNDLYYAGGGAFQHDTFGYSGRPSFGATGLANVYDVSVNHQLGARTTVSAYLGFAQGRKVISRIYRKSDNARFGYIELTQKF